jgi:Glycosyl hydrolase family 65, N-terminal domain./Glycosyl hydrolase family 65, C-terminal domain./Glycosyl hydrolase family 65 central catalytic domain.
VSWKITSHSLNPEDWLVEESLYSLANGYLGVRGNLEEADGSYPPTIKGTYLNAFYDIVEIPYGERLYGFPATQQKLANVIDAQPIAIYLGEDEEPFSLSTGQILSYERTLHLDRGYSERNIRWRSPKGKVIDLRFVRLVSFLRRELFAIRVEIAPVNFYGEVKMVSVINGDVRNYVGENDPRVGSSHARLLKTVHAGMEGDLAVVVDETLNSGLRVACITAHRSDSGTWDYRAGENQIMATFTCRLSKSVSMEKWNVYVDTLRHGEDLINKGISLHRRWHSLTFQELLEEQKQYLDEFWKEADVRIDGDEKLQEGIRFNLFHLLQAAGRDRHSNIAAKGLSGEGYEGHYFWDTEIYMIPVFLMTRPELARQLLLYRYSKLDSAREHARAMGLKKGALYPWRTISGSECSSYFPSGSAQFHISADIAYTFVLYYLATGDEEFFLDYAAELLMETARVWLETGHFKDGKFRIDAVTGPDEYTCIVNNNYYTNAMAKYNLEWAVRAHDRLRREKPEQWKTLMERLQMEAGERDLWQKAAEQMYLPYDEKLGINPQDDTFLQKEVWDFEGTPKDHYPLLLHYHPLKIYRYQVCKQADTVLAHFLLEDEQSMDTIRNSYYYYEKITTHDSSLSTCIFSIMAAKIGEMDKAYRYFMESARLDLDNAHGNTKDGLHMANMGGTWMGIVFGFAGLRIKESGLHLAPRLPKQWSGYACRLQYRKRHIGISVTGTKAMITLSGEPLRIHVYGKTYDLSERQPIVISLPD